jgi:hypothetical protein
MWSSNRGASDAPPGINQMEMPAVPRKIAGPGGMPQGAFFKRSGYRFA